MDVDRLKKIAGSVRTGGKGSVRRKKKTVHKVAATDDKRLQNTLKRLGVNTIPGIEEVMILKDTDVILFSNPKVQASIAANTYVISGTAQERSLGDLPPQMLAQVRGALPMMGGGAMPGMAGMPGLGGVPGSAGGMAGGSAGAQDDDDDDVPDLVEGFDEEG